MFLGVSVDVRGLFLFMLELWSEGGGGGVIRDALYDAKNMIGAGCDSHGDRRSRCDRGRKPCSVMADQRIVRGLTVKPLLTLTGRPYGLDGLILLSLLLSIGLFAKPGV